MQRAGVEKRGVHIVKNESPPDATGGRGKARYVELPHAHGLRPVGSPHLPSTFHTDPSPHNKPFPTQTLPDMNPSPCNPLPAESSYRIFSIIASAISRVPTAVGSSRSGFMS
jgi:hypothetical protein